MTNAGVMYEKAKQPEKAADVYLDLAEKYGDKAPDIAEKAAFSAGQVYEKVIYYDRAAKAYELVVEQVRARAPRPPTRCTTPACCARRSARTRRRSRTTSEYAKKFHERKDAPDVAFNIGVVYENAGDDGHAVRGVRRLRASLSLDRQAHRRGVHARRPHRRSGSASSSAPRRTSTTAQKLWKADHRQGQGGRQAWAAEARYYEGELIFREYEKVTLDVKPAQLEHDAQDRRASCSPRPRRSTPSVVDYQDLKWATAALYRVGQVYDGFAEALADRGDKPPAGPDAGSDPGLPGRASTRYVVDIQDKAVAAVHGRLPEGDPDAGLRRVHREDPRGARPARRRQVPARARVAQPRARSAIGRRRPSWSTEIAR